MSAETDLIRSFVEWWGAAASGIGDDAAVLDVPNGEKLVVSTDASVEGIHFRRSDISAGDIGYRSAAAALSDLAAMAARPIGLLFALVLPVSWRDDASALAAGVGEAANDSSCPIVGGNISSGEQLSITTTVIGASPAPLLRSGARVGDSLYVTGALGAAALAVHHWSAGRQPPDEAVRRFVRPAPRIAEAIWLAKHGATSAIDLSDGLSADASHLADASGVLICVDADLVPVSDGASIDEALSGGEDYELLFTAGPLDVEEFHRSFNLAITRIGSVESGAPGIRLLKRGETVPVRGGFDHLETK